LQASYQHGIQTNILARPLDNTYSGLAKNLSLIYLPKTLSLIHLFQALYFGEWGLATID